MSESRQRDPRPAPIAGEPSTERDRDAESHAGGAVGATFAPRRESIPAARAFVAEQTGLTGRLGQDAALVTSELATNAVMHASTSFEVSVREDADRLRIAVADGNSDLPNLEPRLPLISAISGRGLKIVAQLAERWGAEPNDSGKTVWAELRVSANDRMHPAH